MKKLFLILAAAVVLSSAAFAQASARSGFADGFSIDRYEKKTLGDAYETAQRSYERGISGEHFKSYCHFISQFDWSNGGTQGRFYCDDSYLAGDFTKGVPFPKDIPPFTSLIIYYHFEAPYYAIFPYIDGWEVWNYARFPGQKYIATDNLKIREAPSLSAKQIGRLVKDERATVIEVGEDVTIDGIESAWVKVRAKDGAEGWCFAGYLTDGTEYRGKPWTSGETAISLEKAHFEKILCAYDWYRTDEYRSSILRFYKEDGKLYLNVYLRDCYRDDLCIELQERGLAVEIEETGDGKLFCVCDKIFYYLGKDVFYDGKTRHALYFFDDRPSVYAYDKYESGIGKE